MILRHLLLPVLFGGALLSGPCVCGQASDLRPLSEVLGEVGRRFDVRIVCKRIDPDTVQVAWAGYRIRPYSLAQSLDNLVHPLGLVWKEEVKTTLRDGVPEQRTQYLVQPYEYYRRTPADGEQLLAWLAQQAPDRTAWEARRARIVDDVRAALDLEPMLRAVPEQPATVVGRVQRHDGYTVQNFALETLPGLYVCGTIYAPAGKGRAKRHPLIVAPSGHWAEGRYRPDHQYLMATLARMGAVAVDMDIVGWGESEEQIGLAAHTSDYAMQLQVLWSKRVTDWVLATRSDIDPARIAATGGSGGATHALLLAAVDGRFTALAPVAHLVSHFDGGCPCESGRPVTLAAGGSCTTEILAAVMAPHPVLAVSDGGDWTASYPTLEYPFLQRIWAFYGAAGSVRNAHFPDGKHDLGSDKRQAVYAFFADAFGMDAAQADETAVDLLPASGLQTFGGRWPAGAIRSQAELEALLRRLE